MFVPYMASNPQPCLPPNPQIPLESEQELKKRERVLTGLRNMVLDWIVKIARKKGYSEEVQVSHKLVKPSLG